ncbi:MAG: HPF/RaiA family ribosome-associated protein [Burkholderiales bacterium]|nr:HPF/RaiA family ribosome-associated protein [Burkholderiales bacterium]
MQIQVNTSNGIENTDALERWAQTQLNESLARFGRDITRVEVQLSDETGGAKTGSGDKRCMMEARLANHPPAAVTHHADTQDEAFRGAARKLFNALEHTLGKLHDPKHRDRESIRREPADPGTAQQAA